MKNTTHTTRALLRYSSISESRPGKGAQTWGPGGPPCATFVTSAAEGYRVAFTAPYRWVTSGMPFSMSGGLAGVRTAGGQVTGEMTGVTVTDLAVPTVQKIMTLRTRKTGVAHIYHQSGKVVASPEWDLKRDTAIPRTDPEYAKVENGRDVDELRILAPTEEDASPPTFGSAQLRSRIDEDGAEAGTLSLAWTLRITHFM